MKREVADTPNSVWLSSMYWIIFTNIWVSLSVFCFTSFTFLFFEINYSLEYAILTGTTTLFAYNFQRLLKIPNYNEHKSYRHWWIEKNKKTIFSFSIISALASFVLAYIALTVAIILYSAPFIIFVLLYAYSSDKVKAIREIPFTKNIIISIVWTWVIAVMPFLLFKITFSSIHYTYIALVFLLVLALCIPFDIRDVKLDQGKVKTIATQYGVKKAKIVSQMLLLLLSLVAYTVGINEILYVGLLSFVAVRRISADTSEIYFTGLIDGLFLMLLFFYWVV